MIQQIVADIWHNIYKKKLDKI